MEGHLKEYNPSDLKDIAFKKDENGNLKPIIPKSPPNSDSIRSLYKVCGRWNQYVKIADEKMFDVDETRYFLTSDEKNPIPSHSNYREDIVYRRMKNFITSQDFKEVLEIRQREDRKLRAKLSNKIN